MATKSFIKLLKDVRSCTYCADYLSLPPKPIVQIHENARILVIAQAPSTRARETGLPFNDPSGDRLRTWLGVDRATFYDETKMAFMPMGFCYPGKGASGDLPPCNLCAPLWHHKLVFYLSSVSLILIIGSYAQSFYLNSKKTNQAVKNYKIYLPGIIPLPHPSWHNNRWLIDNPWFDSELVPVLQKLVAKALKT